MYNFVEKNNEKVDNDNYIVSIDKEEKVFIKKTIDLIDEKKQAEYTK